MDVSEQISELRSNFLKKLSNEGGDSVVHPHDLERVKTNDAWLKRFLLHHDYDMNEALKMLWDTCEWRKKFGTNDITENNVRVDFLREGAFFSHGKDVDDCTLFIFKCKKHVKGQKDFEELKRCVIYWFERIEREVNGEPITIFFDMDNCGLSNMDLEFTKYLINLFKFYYPYFLNYIIIYEMAWILNAAFKIIKALLPEKAVAKMKFLNKSSVKDYVPAKHILKCWGGEDDYVFTFVPEIRNTNQSLLANNKKVHFADGSPMSETGAVLNDKDEILQVNPSSCLSFMKDGTELTSLVTLHNIDDTITIAYKMKTTAPEKFRVRPSTGCLAPGAQDTVTVTLLTGFQIGGLSRDKFLVMSAQVESADMSPQELAEFWKNMSGKNVSQHKLRCVQINSDVTKNGNAVYASSSVPEQNEMQKLTTRITELSECQSQLHNAIKHIQWIQLLIVVLIVLLGIGLVYAIRKEHHIESSIETEQCFRKEA